MDPCPDELSLKPEWFEGWFGKKFREDSFSPLEIAARLRMDKNRVYRALNYGDLEAFRIAGRWVIPKPAVRDWLLESYSLNLD
jgi:hypothetical protein